MTKKQLNQKIGFEFSKNGRQYDEFRQNRHSNAKTQIKEITVSEARKQLLTTNKIKKVLSVIGGGKEATVLLAQEKETDEFLGRCNPTLEGLEVSLKILMRMDFVRKIQRAKKSGRAREGQGRTR